VTIVMTLMTLMTLMMPPPAEPAQEAPPATRLHATFLAALARAGVARPAGELERRLAAEYGAMFVARPDLVKPPPSLMFADAAAVARFQRNVRARRRVVGGTPITLQAAAMESLERVLAAARRGRLSITPRGGAPAATRTYAEAHAFWTRRVDRALRHWVQRGTMSRERADAIRAARGAEQVREVLAEEERGHHFAASLDKTILRSAAAPGASQHHAMLALDIQEHDRAPVRDLMAQHGWFQTVVSDLPHFTFLGRRADELPGLGLALVTSASRRFWVPATDGGR
jgi:hypothetical protein